MPPTQSSASQPKPERISDWEFSPDDRLFFDTNIWILLLGIQGSPSDTDVQVYSSAYKRILKAKSVILTDALVLAEFANATLHLRYELEMQFPGDAPQFSSYKNFRESEFFADHAWAVGEYLSEIRAQTQILSVEPPDDWATLSASFQTGARDFNDEMIALQCRRQNAILVTNDRDFKGAGIRILSHNSKYFRR